MLDDLDFVDDLALLWHNHQQMQEKTSDLHHASMQVGLMLNKIEGEELEEVESFTHLGIVMDKSGGTDADVKTRIGKAQSAFNMLKKGLELQRNRYIHQGTCV